MAGYLTLLFFLSLFMGPMVFAVLGIYFTLRYIRSHEMHLAVGRYVQDVYYRSV